MTLYEIDQAIMECVDLETGEIIDIEQLDKLQMERETKLENVACWIKDLKAEAEALKAEKQALAERQKVAENKAESLKKYLAYALDGKAFKTTRASVTFRKSQVVEIADIYKLDENYLRYKEPDADKTAIKEALKAGKTVVGATLVEIRALLLSKRRDTDMGLPVLITGESGSGKTYSIKNMDVEKVGIFAVEKSLLPFKDKGFKVAKNSDYNKILGALKNPQLKSYVIDDSQYLMVNEFFDKAKEIGYQKYTDIGLHFRNLIHHINKNVPDDVIVYFLHHTEIDSNTGKTKAKTVGKMLDNYLTVEGCFNIVLQCVAEGKEHYFLTQSDGSNTAKSPEEMFDLKIVNDLNFVDKTIREYYGLNAESEE